MQFLVLNASFEAVGMIDEFESGIWTDRYNAWGDFEIYGPLDYRLLSLAQADYYLWTAQSEHMMIIEERLISSEVEEGVNLKIAGRSLESILDRRIIWNQTVLSGNFQNAIKKLLTENVISPAISARKIANFIFEASTDTAITSLTVEAQFTGDNLYEAISALCKSKNVGFKVTLNANNQFVFKLYAGVDRSYEQDINPYVIFSPKFENIINSNYLESKQTLKNVAMVRGEGEGAARKTSVVGSGNDLSRREMDVDARDLSQEVDGVVLSDAVYISQLNQRATEKMAENKETRTFEGEVETTIMFIFGKDFLMGDVVQISNEYDIQARARVGELIIAQNTEGFSMVPTFSIVE